MVFFALILKAEIKVVLLGFYLVLLVNVLFYVIYVSLGRALTKYHL